MEGLLPGKSRRRRRPRVKKETETVPAQVGGQMEGLAENGWCPAATHDVILQLAVVGIVASI